MLPRLYEPCETFGGRQTFIGGVFANGAAASVLGLGQLAGGGYPYSYPGRVTTSEPPWINFIGTRFVNIPGILMNNWVRGNIVLVDARRRIP